jgi:hypothetical protein
MTKCIRNARRELHLIAQPQLTSTAVLAAQQGGGTPGGCESSQKDHH